MAGRGGGLGWSYARFVGVAAWSAALAVANPAFARVLVAPWGGNLAFASSRSVAGGVVDQQSISAPGPTAFSGTAFSDAHNDTTGASAFATLNLATSFSDSLFGVVSSGFGAAEGGAYNRGGALVFVWFAVERTQSYVAYPVFGEGNFGSRRTAAFVANGLASDLTFAFLLPGETSSGRLAPGLYFYYYENFYREEPANGSPNSASLQIAFFEVPVPLVQQHPSSQTVAEGTNASFAITAGGGTAAEPRTPQALTYQWRRNYVNLADGGRISGATTNQITISNVAAADSGLYDCIVSDGAVQEPCSAALLTVTGGSVDVGPAARVSDLALARPSPNPFGSSTRVTFTLPHEAHVSLDVYDLGGRLVRALARDERRAAGTHALEWDGRSDAGDAAPSGAYFVRLRAGTETRTQRLIRLAR